jgi:hypothetical protein
MSGQLQVFEFFEAPFVYSKTSVFLSVFEQRMYLVNSPASDGMARLPVLFNN